jgi:hypothetical protein
MSWKTISGALIALVIASSPALACKGKTVLFDDNFTDPDPAWGSSENVVIGKGVMKITSDPNTGSAAFYSGDLFEKGDFCVEVTIPELKDAQDTSGGLLFAGQDYTNWYTAMLSPVGTVYVSRLVNGKWIQPVPAQKVEGMNTRVGGTNTLRVTLDGPRATLYVNDKKIIDFRVSQGGGLFGLRAESEGSRTNPWTFSKVKITSVP